MRRRDDKSEVKDSGSTVAVPLKLSFLNADEGGGTGQVAVKCIDMSQNPDCEGSFLDHN